MMSSLARDMQKESPEKNGQQHAKTVLLLCPEPTFGSVSDQAARSMDARFAP